MQTPHNNILLIKLSAMARLVGNLNQRKTWKCNPIHNNQQAKKTSRNRTRFNGEAAKIIKLN